MYFIIQQLLEDPKARERYFKQQRDRLYEAKKKNSGVEEVKRLKFTRSSSPPKLRKWQPVLLSAEEKKKSDTTGSSAAAAVVKKTKGDAGVLCDVIARKLKEM